MTPLNKLARPKITAPAFVLSLENLWKGRENPRSTSSFVHIFPHQTGLKFWPLEKTLVFHIPPPGSFRVFHTLEQELEIHNHLQINTLGAEKLLFPQLRRPYTVKTNFF